MSTNREGSAGPACSDTAEGVGARNTRRDDQRTTRRSRRPISPGPLGGRPDHRAEALRDRNRRGAHDQVHDADSFAPRGRLRHDPENEERAALGWLRSSDDEERALRLDGVAARPAGPIPHLGPRKRALRPRDVHRRDRHPSVLRRPPQPMATRHQREHQRTAAPILPKGTDLSRWSTDDLESVAAEINSRPRKILGWKTPAEAFDEHLRSVQQAGVASTG